MEKKEIRQAMRALRKQQDKKLALQASLQAEERMHASSFWQKAQSVALYVATEGELSTDYLLSAALSEGKTLFVPRVLSRQEGTMEYVAIAQREDLLPGAFGILEPRAELVGLVYPDFHPDLVLVPGVAFDIQGFRLGFGGGFYDRFFQKEDSCPKIALCFEFQLVQELPREPWDRAMDGLCTEKRMIMM